MSTTSRLPLLDAVKVVATQLIVWHHLALYCPTPDAVRAFAPGLFDWLVEDARLAVQVFLVIGGFLAARSLWPAPHAAPWQLGTQLWRRYQRLVRPYAVAVVAAVVSAALARLWLDHEATPEAPTWAQLAAHLVLLHDLLGYPGLSAGVWYVAIDFQLFALLAGLLWLARTAAARLGEAASPLAALLCGSLMLASLWVFNRHEELDVGALYFFGAYGLGAAAARIARRPRWARLDGAAALSAAVGVALLLEWRSRIALAGCAAVALIWLADLPSPQRWQPLLRGLDDRLVQPLVRLSYAQFLIHYPVLLAVNAAVAHAWPEQPEAEAMALVVSWAISLAAAAGVHRWAEGSGRRSAAREPSSKPAVFVTGRINHSRQ